MKKKKNYINNREFYSRIVEYQLRVKKAQEEGTEIPRIPEYIGLCIDMLAKNLARLPRFANYSYKDEMIQDGIENCILYFNDFNPEKSQNPFAYYTLVIYRAFIRRISKEERQRYIAVKSLQNVSQDLSMFVDDEGKPLIDVHIYDNLNTFMDKFEKKEEAKKQKRKEAKKKAEDSKNE